MAANSAVRMYVYQSTVAILSLFDQIHYIYFTPYRWGARPKHSGL